MSKIILDVRSGERNDSGTGLCLRVVNEDSVQVDGRVERVGRGLYEIGNTGVGSYVLIASGDGEVGVESVDVEFKELGGGYYLTDSRVWLDEVYNESNVKLDHYFGGTIVKSDADISGTTGRGVCGGLFWWSRNDSIRTRYEYANRGWSLLSGTSGVEIGVVGDEGDLVVVGLNGELRIGGGNVSDTVNVSVLKIGSELLPLEEEGKEEDVLTNGVAKGVVLNPSGKVLFVEGSEYTGKAVLHISDTLGVSPDNSISSGSYLSPKPLPNEFPLLRKKGYGYSKVTFVPTEDDLINVGYGEVKVSLDSGKILSDSEVLYEGLVLCDSPVGVLGSVDLGNVIGGVSNAYPVMSVPDGSGLVPSSVATSFVPNGVGLKLEYRWSRSYVGIGSTILPVEFVDKLPKTLSYRKAYVVRGQRKVHLSVGWSSRVSSEGHKLFSGHIALSRGGLSHASSVKLADGLSGTFDIDGAPLSYNGTTLTGSGASVIDGVLVVDSGSVVNYPSDVSEFNSLKNIGLVPDSTLETGLEFVLTRSSIKGYYSYDEEKVSDISGAMPFQFLQFEPREDFSGYGAGQFFKIGDKVLGSTDIETAFGSNPNGFHWITSRTVSSTINQETSRINLGAGLRVGSTTLKITQEQLDGTISGQNDPLIEGVDYDLPSNGLEGQARLISRLGSEILRGQKMDPAVGLTIDLGVDLSVVNVGDFFYDGLNYFKIVGLTGTVITLSSVLGLQEGGRWKIYNGYREGVVELETPDPTKLVGEIFDDLPVLERKSVEIYKVYSTLAFDKVLPSSTLSVRKTENGVETSYPLTVLRDDVLQSPYELSGDHYTSGSYRIKVEGVEYEVGVGQSDKGFTVSNNRVVFESPMGTSNSSWVSGDVIFVRKPRSGLTTTAEMTVSANDLSSPFTPSNTFDDFLELLDKPRFEATSGSISFEDPLESGVGVEVSYTPTDDPSTRIIESMGFVVVQEVATRVRDNEFSYNPTSKEVELLATPTVMVGAEQFKDTKYSINQNTILFNKPIASGVNVKVSYTTLKSNGGDATVRTSSGMVIPKYKISKGSTSLSVQRDFTGILSAGDLLYVGTHIFNVSSVSSSEITVNPSARFDIETEMIAYLNVPTFTYNGATNQHAFRLVIGAVVSAKPKSSDVFLQGDYRSFIQAKSVIVLQGTPYRVKVVGLDDKTGMTKVSVEGFTSGHDFISTNDLYVSFRPILVEGDTDLSLTTGLVDTEEFSMVKYDHALGRGRLLSNGQDYRLNAEAGLINLSNGHTVSPQVSYYLLHTSLSSVKPITLLGGRVSKPSYVASFNQSSPPTVYDGLSLNAKCVVSSPDTFQIRIADEDAYSSEIANELQQSLNQGTGNGGKVLISSPTSQGKAIGVFDLLANDVVARSRINLYNGYVQPVDDIISTTTGKVVGDGDGSFKFNLLSTSDWISPGLEDSITREIYPRYVSMELLTPLNTDDAFPTPETTIKIGTEPPSAKRLSQLLEEQRPLIENEMDDYVLIRQNEKTVFDPPPNGSFPYVRVDYEPVYSQMWERHRFSRLFPTSTRMYSYRNPGALDSSTNGITIANARNNAIGQIENITSLPVVNRRSARFRVYDFSLNGYPSVAQTVGKPTFILSAVPLDEFPIDSATGLPDTTQFASEGGSLSDVIVGNVDRVFNGLQVNSKVSLSCDGGEFYNVINTAENASLPDLGLFPPLIQNAPRNAKVEAIHNGCYVVLKGNASLLKVNSVSLRDNPPKRGDTLIESFARDLDDDTSPTTTFRVGSDIGLKSNTGELVDISLPSINDPDWPIKEIAGQNVPASGLALEGNVDFLYTETTPFRYPALNGEAVDDTGDESIPYISRFSERDLLPLIPPALNALKVEALNANTGVGGGTNEYVYPDEARGVALTNLGDGFITTNQSFDPLSGVCEQTPRQGDLAILRPDDSNSAGCASTGVLEIARISGSEIYPPSFTTPAPVRYSVGNIIVQLDGNSLNGVKVSEQFVFDAANNRWEDSLVTFEFSSGLLPNDTITNIVNKIVADGGGFSLHLHKNSAPYTPTNHIFFIYQNSNIWSVSINNPTTNQLLPPVAVELTVVGNTFRVKQTNLPNPLLTTETWLDYTDMGSWLFNTDAGFWSEYNTYYSSEVDKLIRTSIDQTNDPNSHLYLDFRLGIVDIGTSQQRDTIDSNRVDLISNDTYYTSWTISNEDSAVVSASGVDTDMVLTIGKSFIEVKEEGNSATHTVQSHVNNSSYKVTVINNERLRTLPLIDVSRSNDPVSLFIGSEVDESGNILNGTARSGLIKQTLDPATAIITLKDESKSRLRVITELQGSMSKVLTGDLLYIENGHNAGTHRVLDVIETDISTEITETLGTSQALFVQFPKVVSLDTNTGVLTTDVDDLTQYFSDTTTGSIYIILNDNYTNTPTPSLDSTSTLAKDPVFGVSIIKVDYNGNGQNVITGSDITLVFPCEYVNGTAINTASDLNTILGSYQQVIGGVNKIPFDLGKTGLASDGLPASFGVNLTLQMAVGGGITGSINNFSESDVVRNSDGLVSHINVSDSNLYPDITDGADLTYGKSFLSPNDTITLTVNLTEGIYLDPSFPRLLRDYTGATPVKFADGSSQIRTIADATIPTGLLTTQAGPNYSLTIPDDFYEEVSFTVRRLRRFTDVFSKLIYAFEGFRYLYEQRIGRIGSVAYLSGYTITLTPIKVDGEGNDGGDSGTDTQVGDFAKVVSVGDQVQCLNSSNQETLYLRVLEVGSTLKCSAIRGSVSDVSPNDVFKVITRVPLVPELQAFDRFIEHGFTEIYSTIARAGISVGTENVLTDTTVDFNSLGVAVGDFLVIDPQGLLTGSNPEEYGAPPQGDNGDGTVGSPHVLDDNRGAYKVVSIDDPNTLTVQFYAGDSGTSRTNYKLLPSVSGSDDQPLRVTSGIDGSSYATTNNSIHPFSYRILRRRTTLQESLAGSFLFFRERTLSWVEVIRSFNSLPTQPYTWTQYESENLIDNVGIADRSHPSNDVLLQSILGNETPPFINSQTCLSVYDRRMLIEDSKMTTEMNREPEAGIPTVLENDISSMNARDNRYAWISVRTDQVNGTLSKLSRVDLDNPDDTALEDIK